METGELALVLYGNGQNKILTVNIWIVAVLQSSTGVLEWRKEKLMTMYRKTRKLTTINRALHPTRDVEKIYLPRQKGDRGLINMKICVRSVENNFAFYVMNATEEILIVRTKRSGGL